MNDYISYKESGIEWLGSIPKSWDLIRLKYLAQITTGNKDAVDAVSDGKYPFFIRSKNVECIDEYAYDGEAVLTAGDGDIGKIVHYIDGKFNFHQRVYCIYNATMSTKLIYYYFGEFFANEG